MNDYQIIKEFEDTLYRYCEYLDYDFDSAVMFTDYMTDEQRLAEIANLNEYINELEEGEIE